MVNGAENVLPQPPVEHLSQTTNQDATCMKNVF